jgi:hypothetical protein
MSGTSPGHGSDFDAERPSWEFVRRRHQTALTGTDGNGDDDNYATTNEKLARPVRLERTTLGSASRCSIQLSYGRAVFLRVGSESRIGPFGFGVSMTLTPGGESGIRTHGRFPYTRFPSVRLRPLGHLSENLLSRTAVPSCPLGMEGPRRAVGYREIWLGDTRSHEVPSAGPERADPPVYPTVTARAGLFSSLALKWGPCCPNRSRLHVSRCC